MIVMTRHIDDSDDQTSGDRIPTCSQQPTVPHTTATATDPLSGATSRTASCDRFANCERTVSVPCGIAFGLIAIPDAADMLRLRKV